VSTMSDDVKAAVELWRETAGKCRCLDCRAAMTLLAHIDGEAARTAEAVARAREEMREACEVALRRCATDIINDGGDQQMAIHMHRAADRVEDVPLTSTPLADEVRALKAFNDQLGAAHQATADRAEKAEARVKELEAQVDSLLDDVRLRATVDERDAMRERAVRAEARVYALEAQVDSYFAERDGWIAKADKAEAERDEALAEAAALLDFLQSEENWAWFHAEGMVGGTNEWKSARRRNAETIKAFLAQTRRGEAFITHRNEEAARRVETLLSTPLATEDFKEGVRRAAQRLRVGRILTPVDEPKSEE